MVCDTSLAKKITKAFDEQRLGEDLDDGFISECESWCRTGDVVGRNGSEVSMNGTNGRFRTSDGDMQSSSTKLNGLSVQQSDQDAFLREIDPVYGEEPERWGVT